MISVCPAIEYGLLHTRILERITILALFNNEGNYNKIMKIPKTILPDINWWLKNINHSNKV